LIDGPPFYFIHVPKCGGTSLRGALMAAYGERLCAVYRGADAHTTGTDRENFLDATRLRGKPSGLSYLPRHEVYFGHYRFGIHNHLSRPGPYLSMVRSPLDRLLSEVKHIIRHAHSKFHRAMMSASGLQELVETHRGWRFDNLITRMFSGKAGPRYVERAQFERAVRNIEEHFLFVGHQSSFDSSLSILSGILGRDLVAHDRLNVAPTDQSFDLSRYAEPSYVERLICWDLLLEEFIRDRFSAGANVPSGPRSSTAALALHGI
jgi:hypothetical protein